MNDSTMQAIKHWFFMFFHHHEWDIVKQANVRRSPHSELIDGMWYVHRCKICGKMKSGTLY